MAIFLGIRTGMSQALGSDHDAAERNLCSDPNPGTVGTARVLRRSCLGPHVQIREDERLVSAGSGLWRQMKAGAQRLAHRKIGSAASNFSVCSNLLYGIDRRILREPSMNKTRLIKLNR